MRRRTVRQVGAAQLVVPVLLVAACAVPIAWASGTVYLGAWSADAAGYPLLLLAPMALALGATAFAAVVGWTFATAGATRSDLRAPS